MQNLKNATAATAATGLRSAFWATFALAVRLIVRLVSVVSGRTSSCTCNAVSSTNAERGPMPALPVAARLCPNTRSLLTGFRVNRKPHHMSEHLTDRLSTRSRSPLTLVDPDAVPEVDPFALPRLAPIKRVPRHLWAVHRPRTAPTAEPSPAPQTPPPEKPS